MDNKHDNKCCTCKHITLVHWWADDLPTKNVPFHIHIYWGKCDLMNKFIIDSDNETCPNQETPMLDAYGAKRYKLTRG